MSSPAAIPSFVRLEPAAPAPEVWQRTLRAMASDITVLIGDAAPARDRAVELVGRVFAQVETECTRFDPRSDLMRANAAGESWCPVGRYCFAAIEEAAAAHRSTGGLFDPRILGTLRHLGYVGSVKFGDGGIELAAAAGPEPDLSSRGQWTPGFDPDAGAVTVGPLPIDLGGIGKGLAIRWAAEQIAPYCSEFVIDAGGDCIVRGDGPEADGWHVGVEDPLGGSRPVVVLALRNSACATSSIRLRNWTVGGKPAHHLIDPRTGRPG
ncbi:MAG: FAD:protein FMN transferase, partial [Actinomycetota bacterium]|nr:FAD:protein FMN transferase [Actinomycetota bacterium]